MVQAQQSTGLTWKLQYLGNHLQVTDLRPFAHTRFRHQVHRTRGFPVFPSIYRVLLSFSILLDDWRPTVAQDVDRAACGVLIGKPCRNTLGF